MKLAVFAEMILQPDMETFLSGGGELWQIEAIKLLNKNGIKTEVYQYSTKEEFKVLYGIKINGLGCQGKQANYKFHEITNRHDIDGYFYMVMNLNEFKFADKNKKKIAISHGIFWDDDIYRKRPLEYLDNFKKWTLNLDKIISVDTNTVNVARNYFPRHQHKFEVVSNFADTKKYYANKKYPNNNFRVLCPRRIHTLRGTYPFLLAAQKLTEKYPNIEFTSCGKGFGNDKIIFQKMVENNDRINITDTSYEGMKDMYNTHHISVIPTIGSEGTSLSALESSACETPLVSTLVGGLSDIIHDGFNGKVCKIDYKQKEGKIEYNIDDLIEKIEWFYLNQDKIEQMGKNARYLIQSSFSKEKWDKDIIRIVRKVFNAE